jgi:dolichyl-phosphate beta-glucosyltransferase
MNYTSQQTQVPYLSVIIPAFNEEDRIESTLRSVNSYLSRQPYMYEIIVVNDGSKDKTVEITSKLINEIHHIRLIDNKENHGKGWAVKSSMLNAMGKIRMFSCM